MAYRFACGVDSAFDTDEEYGETEQYHQGADHESHHALYAGADQYDLKCQYEECDR